MLDDIRPYNHSTCNTLPSSLLIDREIVFECRRMISNSNYISAELYELNIIKLIYEATGLWTLMDRR